MIADTIKTAIMINAIVPLDGLEARAKQKLCNHPLKIKLHKTDSFLKYYNIFRSGCL